MTSGESSSADFEDPQSAVTKVNPPPDPGADGSYFFHLSRGSLPTTPPFHRDLWIAGFLEEDHLPIGFHGPISAVLFSILFIEGPLIFLRWGKCPSGSRNMKIHPILYSYPSFGHFFLEATFNMGRVNIDALKPGMVLSEDLKHPNGRLLLGKGVKLDLSHLRILKIWGIVGVEIEGVTEDLRPPALEEIDPAVLQAAEKFTQKRFACANLDHPFLQELFRICTLRRAQRMVLKQTSGGDGMSADREAAPIYESQPMYPFSDRKKDLNSLVEQDVNLASLPHIFTEITKVIGDPRSSAIHVADVISKDPNLSVKLLKIVNSAFYNFPSKIDTISRAVMIVGSKQLSTLALGTSVLKIFQDIPADLVDMKSFWEHSIACGIGARMIASYKNISNTERLFVAGLLHDLGRIIIYKHLPRQGRETLLRARRTNCLLRFSEFETLGFDHTQIGGMLLRKWALPFILEQAVEYHHEPFRSKHPLEATIVHIADILINALGLGTSGERFVPPIIPEVWTDLRLPTEMFAKIVQLIDRQVEEVIHNFFGDFTP